jgi:hypothetical protein
MDVSGFENASFIASTVRLPAAPNEHQYVGGVVVFKTDSCEKRLIVFPETTIETAYCNNILNINIYVMT